MSYCLVYHKPDSLYKGQTLPPSWYFTKFLLPALFLLHEFRPFYLTDFILAVGTLQGGIGAFPEPFRVTQQSDFPPQHHNQAGEEQAPGEKISDKEQRRAHHEMPPVENAAVDAALVL